MQYPILPGTPDQAMPGARSCRADAVAKNAHLAVSYTRLIRLWMQVIGLRGGDRIFRERALRRFRTVRNAAEGGPFRSAGSGVDR